MPLWSPAPPPPPAAHHHHPLPVTSLSAALLSLLATALAVRVIKVRRSEKIPYASDNQLFVKRQRALANLSEYAPLFLVLLGCLEAGGAPHATLLCPLAAAFLAGRTAHAANMGWDANFKWRVRGTMASLLSLQVGAAALVVRVVWGLVAKKA
jgi:uncharacterized protein